MLLFLLYNSILFFESIPSLSQTNHVSNCHGYGRIDSECSDVFRVWHILDSRSGHCRRIFFPGWKTGFTSTLELSSVDFRVIIKASEGVADSRLGIFDKFTYIWWAALTVHFNLCSMFLRNLIQLYQIFTTWSFSNASDSTAQTYRKPGFERLFAQIP